MIGTVIITYGAMAILSVASTPQAGGMSTGTIVLYLAAFFLLSVAIAFISVIAGIGGGVIFTPIMLAFTSVNSVVVRGTGLIVAMFSGLISTGIFIKKGIGNYRLSLILMLAQGIGGLIGAVAAITAAETLGALGEGIMRTALGVILVAIAVYFLTGGKKLEYPEIKKSDLLRNGSILAANIMKRAKNLSVNTKLHALLSELLLSLLLASSAASSEWAAAGL